jgi:hypothetical protein
MGKKNSAGGLGMKAIRLTKGCNGTGPILKGIFATVVLLGLSACAVPGIRQSDIKPNDVMDFVDKNYDNFIISYCGQKGAPTAIRFDLKNDDVTLTGDDWYPVESKAQLHDLFRDLIPVYRGYSLSYRGPYLFEIDSKEGRVIGYLYCLLVELNIRQEGNNYWMGPVTEADIKDERKLYKITP